MAGWNRVVTVELAEAWAGYQVAKATLPPARAINVADNYYTLREQLAEYIGHRMARAGAMNVVSQRWWTPTAKLIPTARWTRRWPG